MSHFSDALARFAGQRRILIASDFDGTLADHVPDLDAVMPVPGAEPALNELARLTNVTVMLISGRRLADLLPRFDALAEGIVTVGEHGAEWSGQEPEVHPFVDVLAAGLTEISEGVDGAMVERKLFGVTLRHRSVARHRVDQLLDEARLYLREASAALDPAPRVEFGNGVLDVSLLSTTKGEAVESVRTSVGAEAVLYFGDDVSDESVFGLLGSADIGVKVGSAETHAAFRVGEPRDVVDALEELRSLRQ